MTIVQSASTLLARLGEPVVFSYEVDEVRDPATGEIITPGSTVEVDGNGYPGRYRQMDVDGETILRSDTRLVVEKVSQRPKIGWNCTVDGKKYRVMDAKFVRKSGEDVIYICQLRI